MNASRLKILRSLHVDAYIVTKRQGGELLVEARPRLSLVAKLTVLAELVDLLAHLHARSVVYGSLDPNNVVLVEGRPRLIDVDTLGRVEGPHSPVPAGGQRSEFSAPEQRQEQLTYLASDIYSFAQLAEWLLEAEQASAPRNLLLVPWKAMLPACLDPRPRARPTSREFHSAVSEGGAHVSPDHMEATPHTILGHGVVAPGLHDTQFVPDHEPKGIRDPPIVTEVVPDRPPQVASSRAQTDRIEPRSHRRLAFGVATAAIVAALVAVALLTGNERPKPPTAATFPTNAPQPRATAVPDEEPDDPIRVTSECGQSTAANGRPETLVICHVENTTADPRVAQVTSTLFPLEREPITFSKDVRVAPHGQMSIRFRFRGIAIAADDIRCKCSL